MLRRVGSLSSSAARASTVGMCAASAAMVEASLSPPARASSAFTASRRTFFPPGTPGGDLLRHLKSASAPTQAFSPLDKLRPPAPPSASDAQPFGSLNRTNRLRRYVNVNTATSAPTPATAAQSSSSSSSSISGTSLTSPPSAEEVTATASTTQMDLSRLVRRHTSSSSTTVAHTTTTTTSAAAAQPHATHTQVTSSAAPAATSTHAAVARAEAAIAAAQQRSEAQAKAKQEAAAQLHASAASSSSSHLHSGASAATKASREHAGDHGGPQRQHSQVYKEHCNIGWSPEEFYRVVADVEHYTDFLPWCAGSEVHTTRRVRVPRGRRLLAGNAAAASTDAAAAAAVTAASAEAGAAGDAAAAELVDAIEMTATLTIGFSFLKEQYTSRVTLYPGTKIVAALYDEEEEAAAAGAAASHAMRAHPRSDAQDGFVLSLFKKAASTAGAAAKRSILKHLLCEWEFCPVPGKPNTVEVVFSVSFEFKNPLHSHMIMSNVVTLMTRSFERRCESLYGPPSATKESLPLLF